MKINIGDILEEITLPSINGSNFSLSSLKGKKVLLTFYRFARCPMCNLRINEILKRYDELVIHLTKLLKINPLNEDAWRSKGMALLNLSKYDDAIFCERLKGKFTLRRGFSINKGARVLIIEDVITTGKSSLECVKLIKKANAKLLGFASIIDRSSKKSLKIKTKIVSHLKIDVPAYSLKKLPKTLKSVPITTPGSRFIK